MVIIAVMADLLQVFEKGLITKCQIIDKTVNYN